LPAKIPLYSSMRTIVGGTLKIHHGDTGSQDLVIARDREIGRSGDRIPAAIVPSILQKFNFKFLRFWQFWQFLCVGFFHIDQNRSLRVLIEEQCLSPKNNSYSRSRQWPIRLG